MQRNVNVTNPFVSGDGSFPFPGAAFLVRLNANKRKPKSNKPVAPIAITDGTGTNDSNTKSRVGATRKLVAVFTTKSGAGLAGQLDLQPPPAPPQLSDSVH